MCFRLSSTWGQKNTKNLFSLVFGDKVCYDRTEPSNEGNENVMESVTGKFAKAVLNRRKQLGLTQDELAKRIGTSKQMVSKYELGQRSPKVAMANAFATALETTLDELLDVEKIEHHIEEDDVPKTDEAKILSKGIDRLPKEQREQALAMFRVMFAPQYAELFTKGTDE